MHPDRTIRIHNHAGYRRGCRAIIEIVRGQQLSGQQDETIAALCRSPDKLFPYAQGSVLALLQNGVEIRPSYVLLSKAGDGAVIPVILDIMPDSEEDRLSVIAPLALILRTAPIDAYFFMSEMWARRDDRPDSEPIKLVVVMAFAGHQSKTMSFTIVKHPETGNVMGLRRFDANVSFDQQNPCLLNLYELADNVIMSIIDGTDFAPKGKD